MKLKEMPANIVVHTPTETEAKELLAILHENGYRWNRGNSLIRYTNWRGVNCSYHIYPDENVVTWNHSVANGAITLAEFKERYCDEEKPQPKFILGDIVKIVNVTNPMLVGETGIIMELPTKEDSRYKVGLEDEWTLLDAKYLKLYTEAEIKEETMKITDEIKKLDLRELLKGHEGETFYHLMYGEVEYKGIDKNGFIVFTDSKIPTIYDDGKYDQHANVVLYPSRALYEQYPLDPYTAWMEWQEEQKKHWVSVTAWIDDTECESDTAIDTNKIYFRTPSDRDKCIEEIKAIIEKYSKE